MHTKIRNLATFAYLSSMAMWIICELGLLVQLCLTKNLSLFHVAGQVRLTDFVHFYLAGKMTLSPERHLFYSWEAQKHFLEGMVMLGKVPAEDIYMPYMPIVFLMMMPYSLLPIDYAHLLFDVVNLCIGLLGCYAVIRYFDWTKNSMARWVLLGALASLPSWNTWLLGQFSWFYVGLICFYLVFMLERRDVLAGLALFLTIIKPHYAIFLLIPAFFFKRFHLLCCAAGWGILFLIICSCVFSWQSVIAYPGAFSGNEWSLQSVHTIAMYCLRPFLELFAPQQTAYYGSLFLLLVAFLLLIFISERVVTKNKPQLVKWLFSVLIVAAILFSPHTYSHDVILLVIPALLTLPGAAGEPQSMAALVWRNIFYCLPIIGWLCYWLVCLQLPGNFIFTGIMAVLFVCGLRQLWTESRHN